MKVVLLIAEIWDQGEISKKSQSDDQTFKTNHQVNQTSVKVKKKEGKQ